MNRKIVTLFLGVVLFGSFQTASVFSAEETPAQPNNFQGSLTAVPLQYASVEGDPHKFEEVNWTKKGYDGGFEDFEFEEKNLPEDIRAAVDGHALIRDNDYEVNAIVEKKNFGYVKLEYQEFSKFYDDMGGTYRLFNVLSPNSLNRDLELQIGHLRVEVGLTVENYPHLMFAYERRFKDGAKSRLNWSPVVVTGVGTREIGPGFQYIDEVVDVIELEESHTLKDIELKGQQTFEWSGAELNRREISLSNNGVASDNKIRAVAQNPQYHLFTTTESAERWFKDDKVFAGTAYHFMTLKNNELENIFEMNQGGSIMNFSNPKQIRNARADNEYNDHAWTGSIMFMPLKWLTVDTKLRSELMDRSGSSAYPSDSTPAAAGGAIPDGIINTTELSRTEDRVGRIGEGVSLRITAIPKTAIYNEFEFEQLRNWLSEDRDSLAGQSAANTGEIFGRETLSYMSRGIWTLGAQVVPVRWLDWTAHFRLNRSNTDYDDKRETQPTASGAKSAFMDAMNIQTNEVATRMTFKIKRWFKPAVRYQYQVRTYDTRAEDLRSVQSSMNSHIFTYEVMLQPVHNLLIVTGVSPQYAWVVTPARNIDSGNTPRFQANVLTWLFNTNYDINERFGLLSGLEYIHCNNFNDLATSGLPLGAAFNEINVTAGFNWKISKIVSLITEYGFLHYNGNPMVDSSNYNGHIVSMRTKLSWD